MSNTQQSIIDNLKNLLSDINEESGYTTNIGDNILEWETRSINDYELPSIEIRENDKEIDFNLNTGYWDVILNVEFTISIKSLTAELIRSATKDFYNCIYNAITTMRASGIIINIYPVSERIESIYGEYRIFTNKIILKIHYREKEYMI